MLHKEKAHVFTTLTYFTNYIWQLKRISEKNSQMLLICSSVTCWTAGFTWIRIWKIMPSNLFSWSGTNAFPSLKNIANIRNLYGSESNNQCSIGNILYSVIRLGHSYNLCILYLCINSLYAHARGYELVAEKNISHADIRLVFSSWRLTRFTRLRHFLGLLVSCWFHAIWQRELIDQRWTVSTTMQPTGVVSVCDRLPSGTYVTYGYTAPCRQQIVTTSSHECQHLSDRYAVPCSK